MPARAGEGLAGIYAKHFIPCEIISLLVVRQKLERQQVH
jgi:hypothetical protein